MPRPTFNGELTSLKHSLANGRISRRTFVQGAMALGVSLVAATTLISEVQAATPKKGGRLRAGVDNASTTDTLDPATHTATGIMSLSWGLRNCLTEIDNEGKLVPELAESWESSDRASQWVIKLRKGVEFHNGKTFDADDVVASINHHRGEDSKSAAKAIMGGIVDIKADDKTTVIIKLDSGNADMMDLLTDYHLVILPSEDGKVNWESGNGTGGYVLESFEPGVRSTAKRNPNYWKEGRAHFDEIEILTILDKVARQTALTTGVVDCIGSVDIGTVDLLKRNKDVRVEAKTGFSHKCFPMFTDVAPFDDNNVRMALKHAIDREVLAKNIWHGYAVPANDHPIAPANRYFAADIPQRQYDPEKAKWYLKQAGLDSLRVDLSSTDLFLGGIDATVLYKEQAAKAGIDINIVREPKDGYWANVWLKKPFVLASWSGRQTEDWMFTTAYAAGVAWNETHWNHERFNMLLVEARTEVDVNKRRELYREMQLIVRDEGGVVVPIYDQRPHAVSIKVQHGPIWGNWDMDGQRFVERWWFA